MGIAAFEDGNNPGRVPGFPHVTLPLLKRLGVL
jgi:hypothetical protein